jgi:hypothetical protein
VEVQVVKAGTRWERKCNVLRAEHFRTTVEVERARSERYGSAIAMVCLAVSDADGGERVAARMAGLLADRKRCSDAIGWWDAESLCVLLTDTDLKGAWVYALRSLDLLGQAGLRVRFSVYSYPRKWFGSDDSRPLSDAATGTDRSDAQEAVAVVQAVLERGEPADVREHAHAAAHGG